ncbi:MAG: hypothetical protein HZA35_00685 [Parcubacteria group bacterium]|nr:hypothetical protein [Parcubacteria group bacterium]
MTVFSYDKVQKRYLWASLVPHAMVGDIWQRLYWPALFSLSVTIMLSLFSYVFFSIAQTDIVFDIKKVERDMKVLGSESSELKVKLGVITSPLRLTEVANERGLVKIQNPLYISSVVGVAL